MRAKNLSWMAILIAVAATLATLPVFAQDQQQSGTAPGVARVSLMKGDVSIMRADSGDWVAATVNTPVMPGDTIATGSGSRAELQLDYSNVLRLDDNTQVKIADLNRSRIQLQVAHGTADLAVFQGNQAASEVDTPNVAVEPLQPGTFRIDVNSNDLSLVTVRDGEAQISTPQGSTNVQAGQQITVEGAQNPQYKIANARPLDNWDQWNNQRNGVMERASNYNHVNRHYTGAQDLGTSGRWQYIPGYDWCWTPYVDAGWVPYSYGRWVWEPYYGWTWVSYHPWGWAPFHYGRWFFYGSSWFWWPGYVSVGYYPVWGPAWVSFIGFGYGYHHFGFGFGWGYNSIGWCPLGPRDPYHRRWGHGRDHSFHAVNINNFHRGRGGRGHYGSNLGRIMDNAHVRRAITTMPANRFGREAVYRNRGTVSAGMLRQASFVRGTLPVVPNRASLTASNRAAVVPMRANRNVNNVHFFSRNRLAGRNQGRSFNTQAASIRQMVRNRNGRSGAVGSFNRQAGRGFQVSGNRENVRVFRNNNAGNSGRVVHAFGNTRAQTEARRGQSAAQGNRQGWSRFGNSGSGGRSAGRTSRQGQAPVVRAGTQSRQFSGRGPSSNARSNQAGGERFSRNSQASRSQAPSGNSQRFRPRGTPSGQGDQNGGGFRRFTPQSAPHNQGRSVSGQGNQNRGGFRRFTPQSAPHNQGRSVSGQGNQNRGGFHNFTPQRSRGYGGQGNNGSRSYNSRPPLRLSKPIVTERRSHYYSQPRGNAGHRGGGFRAPAPRSYGSRGGGFHGGGGHRGGGGFHGGGSRGSASHGGGGGHHR